VHRNVALHQLDQAAADRQAQPGPAEAAGRAGIGLGEGLKELLLRRRVDADAVVGDLEGEPQRLRLLDAHPAGDAAAAAGVSARELDRIAQQVVQHLADAGAVGQHLRGNLGRDEHVQGAAAALRQRQQGCAQPFDQTGDADRGALDLDPAGLDLGEIEDVVNQREQGRAGVAHDPHLRALVFGQSPLFQDLEHAEHAVHRRADLVAHGGEEGRLGLIGEFGLVARAHRLFGFLGDALLELAVAALERLFGELACGDVSDETVEVQDPAVFVVGGVPRSP